MQWFFSCNANATEWFKEMIRVAVISAREYTSLEPHCIFDGEECELTHWMKNAGVIVHFANVPFREELFSSRVVERNKGSMYRPENATGHFLRILVPDYAVDDIVLYTDCDVMFASEPIVPFVDLVGAASELSSKTWTLGPELGSFNSGVMVINASRFRLIREELIEFFRENFFFARENSSYDQVLLNRFLKGKWTPLPLEMNWRPALGINTEAQIVHFHGPKPHRIKMILDGRASAVENNMLQIIDVNKPAYEFYVERFYELLHSA